MATNPVPPAAAVADALVRLGRVPRVGPSAVHRLMNGAPVAGPAVPCRHSGSVDVLQAERLAAGSSLREQLGFDVYRQRQAADPTYDFRRHLRESGGAIET
jgi:hypothetical protein